ncbi:hypothetical protein [Streptomyces erythrochromogenes]|uniref:hypothetical protein n=1 Tax=Streptomyces erythrochromogenes TaxID=285574 RepID=UPI0036744FA8
MGVLAGFDPGLAEGVECLLACPDLFWYAAGAAGGWLLHTAMSRRRRVTAGALPTGETPHT